MFYKSLQYISKLRFHNLRKYNMKKDVDWNTFNRKINSNYNSNYKKINKDFYKKFKKDIDWNTFEEYLKCIQK